MSKATRKGVSLILSQTASGEWQVRRGNKILSRHDTEAEAVAAYSEALAA